MRKRPDTDSHSVAWGGRLRRTKITPVEFRKAFPTGEPLATIAVRALVLYRDLLVDVEGLSESPDFAALDRHGKGTRVLFFVRSNIRTLYGVLKLLDAMGGLPRWQEWLRDLPPEVRKDWGTSHKALNKMREGIVKDRGTFAAHLEGDFGNVVERFAQGFGFAELAEGKDGATHYWPKFADYFGVVAIAGEGPTQSIEDLQSNFHDKAEWYGRGSALAMRILEIFIHRYAQEYPIGLYSH